MVTENQRIAVLIELKNEEFKKSAKTAENAIARLERKFDPLGAAEAKLEKQQKQMNAALKAGTIDAKSHSKAMDLLQREYDQTATRLTGARGNVVAMNSAVAAQTGFMQRNRAIFQQGGYQVGDFAVQVQGGTSALTAFTQQGSQLLGVFGPWGAVMGAVLAVGAPLAGVLWNMGEATEDTKDKAKTFTDRLSEANSALSAMSQTASAASSGGLEALRKKYGELTDEVKEMALALFDIDKREAIGKVAAVISEVTDEIAKAADASAGAVSSALASAGTEAGKAEAKAYRAEIEAMQKDIEQRQGAGFIVMQPELDNLAEMRKELAALEGDFANLGSLAAEVDLSPALLASISQAQAGLEAAREAGDFSGMATQLALVRDLLVEAGDTVSQDVVDGVTQAEALAREMAARLVEGEDAANGIAQADMVGNIASAATSAANLRDILREAAAAYGATGKLNKENPDFFDPRGESSGAGVYDSSNYGSGPELIPGKTAPAPARSGRSRSGGGGRSKSRQAPDLFSIASGELEGLQRQIEMLGKSKSEVAALTVKYKLLDEAKKRGLILTDELSAKINTEAANVGRLADQYELASDKIAAMEQIQGQFKDSVIDAAMGGANAMDQFTNSLKRAAIEYAFFGSGLFAGGKKSGGFGGIFGGVLGSLIPGFANGTNNAPGGLATINERGGEIVNLPSGAQVIPNDISKRMADAGAAAVVRVEIVNPVITATDDGTVMMQARAQVASGINENNKRLARGQRTR